VTPAEQLAESKKSTAPERPKPVRAKIFQCRLRELRTALGLTQEDVALTISRNRFTILLIEGGKGPTLDTAMKIARFFGKTVEEIWMPIEEKA
jgi:DNA-binding XRE family transcriptional regulator